MSKLLLIASNSNKKKLKVKLLLRGISNVRILGYGCDFFTENHIKVFFLEKCHLSNSIIRLIPRNMTTTTVVFLRCLLIAKDISSLLTRQSRIPNSLNDAGEYSASNNDCLTFHYMLIFSLHVLQNSTLLEKSALPLASFIMHKGLSSGQWL